MITAQTWAIQCLILGSESPEKGCLFAQHGGSKAPPAALKGINKLNKTTRCVNYVVEMTLPKSALPSLAPTLLLCLYPWLRYSIGPTLTSEYGTIANYLAEFAFSIAGMAALRQLNLIYISPKLTKQHVTLVLALLGVGYLLATLTRPLSINIPFQLDTTASLIELLLVAPLLEELLFRGVFWGSLRSLTSNTLMISTVITFLFALSHFEAFSRVSQDIRPFIIYQTSYVALLSVACNFLRSSSKSLTTPMMGHFTFNLGFFLGMSGAH